MTRWQETAATAAESCMHACCTYIIFDSSSFVIKILRRTISMTAITHPSRWSLYSCVSACPSRVITSGHFTIPWDRTVMIVDRPLFPQGSIKYYLSVLVRSYRYRYRYRYICIYIIYRIIDTGTYYY
jgi:hypothetical protein